MLSYYIKIILDNLEDIKWIIVSFCDYVISYKLLTNFEDKLVIYSLSCEQTNQEEFESLEGRIKDLNPKYEYKVVNDKIAIGLPEYLEYLELFEIIENYKIEKYTFNDNGSIDVNGDVNLHNEGLTKLPIKFRNFTGDFICTVNKLTSLEGSPKTVGTGFYCDNNNLTSLEDGPETVGDDFNCSSNNLTSLEGCPETVSGDFDCTNNKLTSLVGSPKTIGGDLHCRDNNLTSLEGIGDVKGKIYSDL